MDRRHIVLLIGGRILALDKVAATWRHHLIDANPDCEFAIYASLNSHTQTDAIIESARVILGSRVTITHQINDYSPMDAAEEKVAYNVRSMYWHNEQAMRMASESPSDLIIKWRADIELLRPFVLPGPPASSSSSLYIPYGNDWGGVNDQIAFGSPDTMRLYCDLYNHIKSLWPIRHPERLLKRYICDNPGIHLERVRIHYRLHPDRFVST